MLHTSMILDEGGRAPFVHTSTLAVVFVFLPTSLTVLCWAALDGLSGTTELPFSSPGLVLGLVWPS